MNGFLKILLASFDEFNADALARMQEYEPNSNIDIYTTYNLDADPLYCWVRVEKEFTTAIMTDEEKAQIKTYDEAISGGMQVTDE